ncbi:MAG: hypothetical protein WDN31_05390 [Hyphomicrobium sp.]
MLAGNLTGRVVRVILRTCPADQRGSTTRREQPAQQHPAPRHAFHGYIDVGHPEPQLQITRNKL